MNSKQYKVIATWGAQKHTTELGTFDTLEGATYLAENWQDAPMAKNMHFDLIEVIKVTYSKVWWLKRPQSTMRGKE